MPRPTVEASAGSRLVLFFLVRDFSPLVSLPSTMAGRESKRGFVVGRSLEHWKAAVILHGHTGAGRVGGRAACRSTIINEAVR